MNIFHAWPSLIFVKSWSYLFGCKKLFCFYGKNSKEILLFRQKIIQVYVSTSKHFNIRGIWQQRLPDKIVIAQMPIYKISDNQKLLYTQGIYYKKHSRTTSFPKDVCFFISLHKTLASRQVIYFLQAFSAEIKT